MERAVPKPAPKRYSLAEYFKLAAASETKLEYRDGEIIDMAGAKFEHNQIVCRLCCEIGNRLKGTRNQILVSRQRIRAADARYCYPDVVVFCGQPQFDPLDSPRMTLTNPQVLFEVLSPKTEATDRSEKLVRYINLPTMREYFLVAQDKPMVESFVRKADGSWSVAEKAVGLEATVVIPSLNISLPMNEIYANVRLADSPE
jgi:Uma2 family endonuclease